MKLHNILDDLLNSRSKVRILRLMQKHQDREFTEHEIADMISMSPNTVNLAMRELRRTNIFHYRRIGRAHSYRINFDSVLYRLVKNLFENEKKIRESLFGLLKKDLEGVGTVLVYGSFAREKEDFDSDLDIMIVTKDKNRAEGCFERLSIEVLRRYSVVLSPVYYTPGELARNYRKPFLKNALNEGIYIIGDRIKVPK